MKSIIGLVPALLLGSLVAMAPLASRAETEDGAEAIRAALADPDRPAKDRERDRLRKPQEVLSWLGIGPGMRVADLMAGGGWYTEVLARVVGPKGHVYAQNNATSASRYGKALAKRISTSKLTNVTVLERELEDPGLPAGKLDAVLMVLFYHDTYWMKVDRARMNRAIFEALKPGGVFAVIDHRAEAGSGERDVKSLHRVDAELVESEVLAAGFELASESDLLESPLDHHTINVFDAAIRGRTDRFAFEFRKPR